ncbi:MAG: hypothetical protein WC455_25445 [Dehalococcoidia bacterium]|jgi:hypothetical protein
MRRKTSRNPVYLADVVDDSFSKHYAGNYASQGAASAHIAALREMGIAAGYEQKGKRHLVFTTMKVSPDKKSAAYKRFANPTTGDGKNLIDIMCQATMSAYAAHTRGKTVDSAKACEAMRRIIKTEWPEFKQVMKDALDSHMGDAMYRGLMNTYANAWAVKAIEDSGTGKVVGNPASGAVRRPSEGETLVCTRALSGHDLIPGIAKGDRAVYLGHSQIRMLTGAAAGWVFTLEIGAPFNIVPKPAGNPASELGTKSATDLHISKWFGRYVELMDASGNREVYVWAHLTPEEQRIIIKNSRLPRNEWASAPSRFNIPPLNFPNPGRAGNPIVAYRGWTVRKSGPDFLRVYDPRGYGTTPRVKSVEAGKALIDCSVENRVMTPQEHKLIYQNPLISRSAGTAVGGGFIVGGGYQGATDLLDNTVKREAELLSKMFNRNVQIRFNSGSRSGGAWLVNSIKGFAGNCQVGLTAALYPNKPKGMDINDFIDEKEKHPEKFPDVLHINTYVKESALRDPSIVSAERTGSDGEKLSYVQHKTVAAAVKWLKANVDAGKLLD